MPTRVEPDRHINCRPGHCVAPAPRLRGNQVAGPCMPRRCWWLRTTDGRGRRVSLAFPTEDAARVAAAKMDAARVLGQDYQPKVVVPAIPSFAEVAKEALGLYARLMKPRASTLANHEAFLRDHIMPHFGTTPMTADAFTVLAMQRFILAKQEKLSDATIRVNLPTLRLILDHAVKLNLLPANPLRTGERLWRSAPATESVDPFTSSELRALLRAARTVNTDVAVLLQVMMQSGIRPGEALGLRRGDITLATGTISVRGSFSDGRMGPTKNAHGVRRVSLLYPTTEDRPEWSPTAAGIGPRHVLDGLQVLVATTADAEARLWPMTSSQFARLWRRICTTAGVRYRKPHALRHSFASILLSRNAPILAVQKAGGWSTPIVMLKTYAHWIAEEDSASSPATTAVTPQHLKTAEIIG